MIKPRVKFCGLSTPDDVAAAVAAQAAYVGFVFFAKSPRNVSVATARTLALTVPVGIAKVGLVVNASDADLDAILADVPLDILQLHGSESPERVVEVKQRYGLPVMKAVGIATAEDITKANDYAQVADQLLLDAKPAPDMDLPGGNGLAFDWRLLQGQEWDVPWMLAGGLSPLNVARAVEMTGAQQVDVSSGIESVPGQKDAKLMADFAAAAALVG